MAHTDLRKHKLGWIGTGRMGFPMAGRLLKKGADVAIYNRTRAKAEPLVPAGGRLVDSPAALADRDIVFTMVSTSDDLLEVTLGPHGVLSRPGHAPNILVDCSTVSQEASGKVRAAAAPAGSAWSFRAAGPRTRRPSRTWRRSARGSATSARASSPAS